MSNKNKIEELNKRSVFYDEDVLQEFEELIINELDEKIEEQKNDLKSMTIIAEKNRIEMSFIKNMLLTKYNIEYNL